MDSKQWHDWAAETLAKWCEGLTSEFTKLSDDELQEKFDRVLRDALLGGRKRSDD